MRRRHVLAFFQKLPPFLVGIEACAPSHHWSRELQALGHTVRLMPPLLLRRWARAKTGEGQVVLLSGEAGIGKSRLAAALIERLAAEPHARFPYFCSPQRTDSAFYPIIGQFERAAGFGHGEVSSGCNASSNARIRRRIATCLDFANDGG